MGNRSSCFLRVNRSSWAAAISVAEAGTDTIAIRLRTLFSLGYDHRLVDGADAARFLARLKDLLESFPEEA